MNVAEYIAYLIGDSTRTIIPPYLQYTSPVTLSVGNNDVIYNLSDSLINDIEHPVGVRSIYGEDINGEPAISWHNGDTWEGELTLLEKGKNYIVVYEDIGTPPTVQTMVYGLQTIGLDTHLWDDNQIPYKVLNEFVKASIRKTSKLLPKFLRLHMIGTREFTAEEYISNTSNGFSISNINSDSILAISRYDGEMAYECRKIPAHMRAKAAFGSGFLEECSETDPVFYIQSVASEKRIFVLPTPEETGANSLDGFCEINYIKYPEIDVMQDSVPELPPDVQDAVFVATAIRCKEFELGKLIMPDKPEISTSFNPNSIATQDVIGKVQNIIDDTYTDTFNNEDIEMAENALKSIPQQLSLASTNIATYDKRGAQYLSQYSQDISKFSAEINKYVAKYKKISAELDSLRAQYQEEIYALRGQLPSKKQLSDSDKKLESIKQVVNKAQ